MVCHLWSNTPWALGERTSTVLCRCGLANVAAVSRPQFFGRYATSQRKILRSGVRSYKLGRQPPLLRIEGCGEAQCLDHPKLLRQTGRACSPRRSRSSPYDATYRDPARPADRSLVSTLRGVRPRSACVPRRLATRPTAATSLGCGRSPPYPGEADRRALLRSVCGPSEASQYRMLNVRMANAHG